MTTAAVVLWVYYSFTWTWMTLPMTPGWASIGRYDTFEECMIAGNNQENQRTLPFTCLDVMWNPGEVSQIDMSYGRPAHAPYIDLFGATEERP